MKGRYVKMPDGRIMDKAPCDTCKHKNKMTVEAPCYNCIAIIDLALHKPNAETEFAAYEKEESQ